MELINVAESNIDETSKYGISVPNNLCCDSHFIRTNNNLSNSFSNTSKDLDISKELIDERKDTLDNSINIYRYKFTNEFTDELFKFSKIHQYDHRKDFKEAWELWMEDNNEIIDEEVRRLSNLGYEGDIIDKMFKSARYYFRKKSTEKKAPLKRRIYVGSQKELLEAMDNYIKTQVDSKPSDGFDDFCKNNVDLLKEQVTSLLQAGITDSNEIKAKIKKTYKNRYFLAINKNI